MANTVAINVVANASKASRSLRGVAGDVQKLDRTAGRAAGLKNFAAGLAGGIVADTAANTVRGAVKAAQEYQSTLNQVSRAVQQNAGVSGQSVASLRAQAAAIESLNPARLDESEILAGQTQLLRAGVVGQQNFSKAQQAAADLAIASNTSYAASSKVLSKALADPTKATAALRRAGVVLSAAQQSQIKSLVATGDKAAAQGIVLDALRGKVDGLARASGQGAAGDIARLQDTFEDTSRDLATKLIPAATTVLGVLSKYSGVILPVAGALGGLYIASKAVAAGQAAYSAALTVGGTVSKAFAAGQWLVNAALTANPVGVVVVGIAALVAGFVIAYKKSETFRKVVTGAFNGVKTVVVGFGKFWIGAVDKIVSFFGKIGDAAKSIGGTIYRALIGGIGSAYRALPSIVRKGIEKIPGLGGVGKSLGQLGLNGSVGAASVGAAAGSLVQNNYYQVKNVPTQREQRLAANRARNVNGRS